MRTVHKHDGKLLGIVDRFNGKKILLVGDVILDKYTFGEVSRISPEAPVPILSIERGKDKYVPGGAANAANNIAALGGKVLLASVTGNDSRRNELISALRNQGVEPDGLVVDESRPTIMKTRVVAQNQQLIRIDHEKTHFVLTEIENKILDYISDAIQEADAVIISDYGKGVITKSLVKQVFALAKKYGKKVIVDPKQSDPEYYRGSFLVTPNLKEASELSQVEPLNEEDIIQMGKKLALEFGTNILITRGKDGMSLFQANEVVHIPTKAREVYDVSGAGDTVVGTLALALAAGAELVDAVVLANYAAGIVVGKFGTATTNAEELKKYIQEEARGH
ncbi:D-glycero-beta-D-manno-heptose-7-phosphate kinase [Candidatus Woesearchaeota archaeon]|nr:D-glycero-beta-D-manno-heptose-7-phosphate kinase [Candidatus Woesearchaeota archaeon]